MSRGFVLKAALVLSGVAPLGASPLAWAQADAGKPKIAAEKRGRWTFEDSARPVKAVLIGGSVAAWPRGGFAQFLEAACPRLEIRRRAKARIGAKQLHERFTKQVLKNRRLRLEDHAEVWLIFMGGLNSIGTPRRTNRYVARTLQDAHRAGLKTMGLTVGPWGSERDRRFKEAAGLRYHHNTRLSVDFTMGRLKPGEAFGAKREGTDFEPGELPDIAVDLYGSPLRDAGAPPRERTRRLERLVAKDKWVKGQLRPLPRGERPARLETLVQEALALPARYLRAELQAFDHIHPNLEGHRIIAQEACAVAPPSWGCQCGAIAAMTWDAKAGLSPVVAPPAPPATPAGSRDP